MFARFTGVSQLAVSCRIIGQQGKTGITLENQPDSNRFDLSRFFLPLRLPVSVPKHCLQEGGINFHFQPGQESPGFLRRRQPLSGLNNGVERSFGLAIAIE
jgi:hypothetical protein